MWWIVSKDKNIKNNAYIVRYLYFERKSHLSKSIFLEKAKRLEKFVLTFRCM